jgi:hypothetical protein
MLLIYPPAARSTEPPPGIARLAGALKSSGVPARTLDLCQEGLDWLLGLPLEAEDTWTKGALARRGRASALIRSPKAAENSDRYARAVLDLNRALKAAGRGLGVVPSLANYEDSSLSPLKAADLRASASRFEENLFFPFFERRLEETFKDFPAGNVGISVSFLSQALCAFAIAGYIRARHPEKRIVLGGGLVTSWVAQGRVAEGESFGGLVDAIIPGRGEEGLGRWLGATLARSAAPDYDDLAANPYFSPRRVIPYNFTTGCPWKKCVFCPEKAEDSPYFGLGAAESRAEIEGLVKRYEPGLLHFTDNEIAPLYLAALAENPPGAPWYGFARFSPRLADPGFCRRLAVSGCLMLQLGLESGDQAVLDAMGKGTRIGEIERILDNLKAAGIGTYLYVLFGTPSENRESALVTRDFIEERAGSIDFLNVAVFNMPSTSEEAPLLSMRDFYEGELSLYREFVHPRGWNRDAVRSFLSRDFETSPGIKSILLRNPPVFTSNHAPFFLGHSG